MPIAINQREFELFREYLDQQCGLVFGDDKKYLIETRLTSLVVENGCKTFEEFYRKVKRSTDISLRDHIIDAITTNETMWFRDGAPWVALKEHLLPNLAVLAAKEASRKFRIWSAACSTGQEPFSLAMLIDEFSKTSAGRALSPDRVEILATDVSPMVLFIARSGRYDKISMRRGLIGDWERYREKYFTMSGGTGVFKPEIRSRVQFKRFNLQDDPSSLGKFDIVLLRNVAIYFSDLFRQRLLEQLVRVIQPNGYLIVGVAESLRPYTMKFVEEQYGRTIVYRLK